VTPNLHTAGDGYEEIRVNLSDPDSPRLYHHRLLAFAWGTLDALDADQHVDHRVEVGWLNTEANLRAVEPTPHAYRTNVRAQSRQADPDGYSAEDVEEILG
jgi:hypothetical protein